MGLADRSPPLLGGLRQGAAISESPVHGRTMKGGFLGSLAAHGLGGSESATPWGLATRNGDLRIACPWEDHEGRFPHLIGGSWAWRIGVRHSLGACAGDAWIGDLRIAWPWREAAKQTTLASPVVRITPRSLPAVLAQQDPRGEVAKGRSKVAVDFSSLCRVEERTEVLAYIPP